MDDQEQLKLLSIFHYVVAAFAALFGCMPIMHLAMGLFIVTGKFNELVQEENGEAFPEFFGWFFVGAGAFAIALCWSMAIAIFLNGRKLARRRRYHFCLVMAGVECFFLPFGTVLGVFTIIVLMRPSVRAMFGVETTPPAIPR